MADKKPGGEKLTLTDADIVTGGRVSRRGVMQGAGVGAVGLAAGAVIAPGRAEAGTDNDNGPITDPGGRGRGYCRSYGSGVTDADSGNWTDPGGSGRGQPGVQARGGWTDQDNGAWTDPGGNGRGYGRSFTSGMTDIDQGNCSDPGGNGRG
ncbi:twin-arginine translocation signal domain-containing protein [Rhodobacterales bacterium HKCCE3408]|nr:twin-arginine translocation signal domain-containing protein [Rhodobacterales bacterium HKCCE3408]